MIHHEVIPIFVLFEEQEVRGYSLMNIKESREFNKTDTEGNQRLLSENKISKERDVVGQLTGRIY